jgi:hypothetical protein
MNKPMDDDLEVARVHGLLLLAGYPRDEIERLVSEFEVWLATPGMAQLPPPRAEIGRLQ